MLKTPGGSKDTDREAHLRQFSYGYSRVRATTACFWKCDSRLCQLARILSPYINPKENILRAHIAALSQCVGVPSVLLLPAIVCQYRTTSFTKGQILHR